MTSAALASRFRSENADQSCCDPNQVIARAEQSIAELVGREVTIQFALSPDVRRVAVPFVELERVVLALCAAAQRTLVAGGRIVIETRSANDAPVGTPSDPALPMRARARLVVRNEQLGHTPQASSSVANVSANEKLDLARVEELLERLGGRLELVALSEHDLAYVAHLPVASPADSSGRMMIAAPEQPGVILLVEDEPQVQAVTARILRAFGYGVVTAHNERTAFAHAEQYGAAIRLVVSDLVLPGVSGKELVRRLRQPCEHARVLYISGYSPEHVGALSDGACFLRKPFTAQELLAVVRQLLPESVH